MKISKFCKINRKEREILQMAAHLQLICSTRNIRVPSSLLSYNNKVHRLTICLSFWNGCIFIEQLNQAARHRNVYYDTVGGDPYGEYGS